MIELPRMLNERNTVSQILNHTKTKFTVVINVEVHQYGSILFSITT
jgi:hypothetical protein